MSERDSGYAMSLEAHREQLAAAKAAHDSETVHLRAMAAERTILADAYDGMSAVTRRLLDNWVPMRRVEGEMAWRKRSWNPPKWEDMTSAEYEALLNLMGIDWEPDQ